MDFLIPAAYAQSGGASSQGSFLFSVLPIVVIVVFFLFALLLPQMRRQKEHKRLLESLDKGSEIVTTGGLAGRVRQVGENFLVIEIAEGTEVRVQKNSVTSVMPKGSLDSL